MACSPEPVDTQKSSSAQTRLCYYFVDGLGCLWLPGAAPGIHQWRGRYRIRGPAPATDVDDRAHLSSHKPPRHRRTDTESGMLQFFRAERVVPPYPTRGDTLIELVRIDDRGS